MISLLKCIIVHVMYNMAFSINYTILYNLRCIVIGVTTIAGRYLSTYYIYAELPRCNQVMCMYLPICWKSFCLPCDRNKKYR